MVEREQVLVTSSALLLRGDREEGDLRDIDVADEERRRDGQEERRRIDLSADTGALDQLQRNRARALGRPVELTQRAVPETLDRTRAPRPGST